jgi:GT2 family glycosyltransferase
MNDLHDIVKNNELVSVIIPTFGRPKKLEKCLRSVINSNYPNLEVIVIEDPSPFGHTTIGWEKKFPNVTFIRNKKRYYQAKNRNIGIKHAKGKYIFFLDDDNVVHPNCIRTLMNTLKDPKIGFVGPVAYYLSAPKLVWSAGVKFDKFTRRHVNFKYIPSTSPYDVDIIINAYMTRRDVLERIGLFDHLNFSIQEEEHDLQHRAKKAGYRIVVNPSSIVWHDYPQSISLRFSPQIIYEIWRSRIVFERKHKNYTSMIFLPILIMLLYGPYYSFTILKLKNPRYRKADLLKALLRGIVSGYRCEII